MHEEQNMAMTTSGTKKRNQFCIVRGTNFLNVGIDIYTLGNK
jgi:hypothetical protein